MTFVHNLEVDRDDAYGHFSSDEQLPMKSVAWASNEFQGEIGLRRTGLMKTFTNDRDDASEQYLPLTLNHVFLDFSELRRAMPSMTRSEVSDASVSQQSLTGTPTKKRLTWSDESGQNLVQFQDEGNAAHEPAHQEISAPPRSALLRSRSVKTRLANKESRYLPKALAQPRNKQMISTLRCNSSDPVYNIESPEWGWYIRTTPPTPEMYCSRTISKPNTIETLSAQSAAIPHPNPVFQGLQNKNRDSPMGCPSIPL